MKRKIASLLSLTMVLSSFVGINTFAEELGANTSLSGSGSAGVNAIDTAKYRIILPATPSLNYIVDPQGLAQLGDSGEQVIGDLDAGKGKVYSNKDVAIANRSSKDVKVTATVTATAQEAADGKTVVGVVDDISSSTDASVQLYVVTDEADFSVVTTGGKSYNKKGVGAGDPSADADSYKVETSTSKPTDDKTGYLIKNDSGTHKVAVPVVLKKADYVATSTTAANGSTTYSYDIDDDSIGGAVSFSIAGKCTDNTTWDKNGIDLLAPNISVTYKFEAPTDTEIGALGEKSIHVIETGISGDKSNVLQTSPMLVTSAASTEADTSKMTIKLLSGDNTAVKTDANDVTLLSLKVDGSTVANPDAVVGDDGTITITNAAFNDKDGKEAVAKISYDGKVYVAKGTIEVPPTAVTVVANTEKTTITLATALADTVAVTDITDLKIGSTSITVSASNVEIGEDRDTITITEDLTATEDDVVVSFKIGDTKYKGTASEVAEAVTAITVTDVNNQISYKTLSIAIPSVTSNLDETKVSNIKMDGSDVTSTTTVTTNAGKTRLKFALETVATQGQIFTFEYNDVLYTVTVPAGA